jgi:hypothetical protein
LLDSNVARLVSRGEQARLLARARALPDAPTCADCGARLGAGARASRHLCSLCYANRLVHGGQILLAD